MNSNPGSDFLLSYIRERERERDAKPRATYRRGGKVLDVQHLTKLFYYVVSHY